LKGWTVKLLRPTLLNKGVKIQSRRSFAVEEYRTVHSALRSFHKHTTKEKSAATRETLRNYVLFLANTGVRHGTEALGIKWRQFEWYLCEGERYLAVSVDGKTNKRTAIALDRVVNLLWRQAQLNSRIRVDDFDGLITSKSAESVFTTWLSATVTVQNINCAFNALLDELDLKTGADDRTRTL
jgi:integrase